MKVLFVSVFYNREHCVDESVNSMLDQSYDDLHIVLWDDASTDNTFAELLKFKSERVSVLRSSTNQGFTKALIEAINSNESDLIAIHGSGDISHPYRIVRQVEYLIAHSDCGVCGCHVSFTSESVNLSGVSKRNDSSFKDEMRPPLTHGEVMFRRSLYNQVGGYREFFRMSQDYDLWMRFRDQGVDFGVWIASDCSVIAFATKSKIRLNDNTHSINITKSTLQFSNKVVGISVSFVV